MNLKETKFYFEDMFFTNWTSTPVHFAAQQFDKTIKTSGEWINLYYTPVGMGNMSLSNQKASGAVNVVCWADTDLRSMEIADEVMEFMTEFNTSRVYTVRRLDIIDHGWQTATSAYTIVSFKIEYFEGCDPHSITNKCVNSIGTETGTEWVLGNTLINDCVLCKA
jgi:hypothetical protein